jgi:hypothetical protein
MALARSPRGALAAAAAAAAATSLASSSSAPPAPLSLVLFNASFSAATGARCLDGSPSGFYISDAGTTDPSRFVIFLEGGGACYGATGSDDTNCFVREKSALGSSTYWAATFNDTNNLLSGDASINPFAAWTRVFVPYCSGDVHSGTRTAVVSPALPFFFSGHLTVAAVVAYLSASRPGLASASAVLLSGSSAGGIGTFLHADWLRAALPRAADVRAAPQSGFFFPPIANYTAFAAGAGGPPWAGSSGAVQALWGSYLPPACVAAQGAGACGTLTASYPYIATPLHVAQNQVDSQQLFGELGVPANNDTGIYDYGRYYQVATRAALTALVAPKQGDALWAPACLAHTENVNLVSRTAVGGTVTYVDSLMAWWNKTGAVPRVAADACDGIACGAGCPPTAGAAAAAAAAGRVRW